MKKLETKSTVLLKHHLKALKLPTILAECEKVAARCAKENVDHLGFLLQLCELELLERERRAAARRLKAAKLPTPKALDTFDFTAAPSVIGSSAITPADASSHTCRSSTAITSGRSRHTALSQATSALCARAQRSSASGADGSALSAAASGCAASSGTTPP